MNITTTIYEAKALEKHFSCDIKCKFKNETIIQLKNETIIHATASTKNIILAKTYYSWNHRTFICENGQYLKGVADTSVIVCDEIINSTDSASRNVTKAISTNVMSTLSTNFHNKKVRY